MAGAHSCDAVVRADASDVELQRDAETLMRHGTWGRVYLESGECGCRRVAVVFLHHSTILKKQWRAFEDTPLPLSPSARQLCAAEPQTLAWYVRPLCAPRRALAVQPRRRRRVARFARARAHRHRASVDQRHRIAIGSRRRPSCAGLAQTSSRRRSSARSQRYLLKNLNKTTLSHTG